MTILNCQGCGGTHYGTLDCPYRCDRCGTNAGPCGTVNCPRNRRWGQQAHFTAEPAPSPLPQGAAQGLSDEQIDAIPFDNLREFARAIEAATRQALVQPLAHKELMQQALTALECTEIFENGGEGYGRVFRAIFALREAIKDAP